MDKRLLGSWGEAQAADYLRGKGFRIRAMNFRCRMGELDIIAEDKHFLIFAEVKLRKNSRFAQAREFVTPAKQERIRAAALLWLSQNPTRRQPRFDVIEIYAPRGMDPTTIKIQHLENAFM